MPDNNASDSGNPNRRVGSASFIGVYTLAPILILLASVLVAITVLYRQREHLDEVRESILAENKLKMESTVEHVEGYFASVFSVIRYVSSDPHIKAMKGESIDHVQSLFDHEWRLHRLFELYVIKRDFDGSHPPFITFEYGSENKTKDEVHSLGREQEEYAVQIEQIERFGLDQSLEAQISKEVNLCLGNEEGKQLLGLVYSVPIYSDGGLAGIAAAMLPTENLETAMERGNFANMVVLTNKRGDVYGCEDLPTETRAWFEEQHEERGASAFFSEAEDVFQVGKWTTIWAPIDIVSNQQWWLAFQYDESAYLDTSAFGQFSGSLGIAAGIVVMGILLAGLVHITNRRFEDRVGFFQELQESERGLRKIESRVWQAQKTESLLVMAGSIAHNFNNILMIVMNNLEVALAELPKGSPVKGFLKDADEAVKRATELSGLMLTSVGQGQTATSLVDLTCLVENSGDKLSDIITNNISLTKELPRDIPLIKCDSGQIEQVLMSIVVNAAEAISEENGAIVIKTGAIKCDRAYFKDSYLDEGQAAGDYVYLEVSDTGCGMDADTRLKIFDPYFTTKFTGRGLGLAAVLGIVRGHDGAITLESEPGQGTTIRVLFPVANENRP